MIMITSHTMTITPKTISIKVSIIVLFLITLRWLMSGPSWRRPLINMFNPSDQVVNSFSSHEEAS
jgi:hypothetical protein